MNTKIIRSKYLIVLSISLLLILSVLYFYFGGMNKKNISLLKNNYDDSVLVFAHRGLSQYYPENSYDAIMNAKLLGFKAIEIDLNETKDSKVVLFHDDDCKFMLGLLGSINNFNLDSLYEHPYIFNGKQTANFVMTLDEVLNQFGNDFIFYLDLKKRTFEFAKKIVLMIKKSKLEKSIILASPDFFLIAQTEYFFPEINTCIEGFDSGNEWTYYFVPAQFKPDYYAGFINSVDKNQIDWLKSKSLLNRKIVYGVDVSNFNSTRQIGISNIIINYDSTFNFTSIN